MMAYISKLYILWVHIVVIDCMWSTSSDILFITSTLSFKNNLETEISEHLYLVERKALNLAVFLIP